MKQPLANRAYIKHVIRKECHAISWWCQKNNIDARQFYHWLNGVSYSKNGIGESYARRIKEQFNIEVVK